MKVGKNSFEMKLVKFIFEWGRFGYCFLQLLLMTKLHKAFRMPKYYLCS